MMGELGVEEQGYGCRWKLVRGHGSDPGRNEEGLREADGQTGEHRLGGVEVAPSGRQEPRKAAGLLLGAGKARQEPVPNQERWLG